MAFVHAAGGAFPNEPAARGEPAGPVTTFPNRLP